MGKRPAGAAIVTLEGTLWAKALSPGTSAQRAELIALTMTLELDRGKRVNIYTDIHYVFASLHVHRTIYKDRRLLTTEGKTIKNKQDILNLLKAVWDPKQVAMIYCPEHQKGDSTEAIGNQRSN